MGMLGRSLPKAIEIGQDVIELCFVMFPREVSCILKLDKSCFWKAFLNTQFALPVYILLTVGDHDGKMVNRPERFF